MLGEWRKYLDEYDVTEERYLRKIEELKQSDTYQDPQQEAVWRLIYEINLVAHHTKDAALMERTYRTMALMTYDMGEDSKSLVELSMQYRLIQLDNASSYRTNYSHVEMVPGCQDCLSKDNVFEISIARALIPVPCKHCKNRTDKGHPYGLCECTWRPYKD
ncbi:MAG: hypothetical protein ABR986_06135 [Methanomassiliicoccales archaeon]|jgi:hypothetical protein